jgi:hypothetical protein
MLGARRTLKGWFKSTRSLLNDSRRWRAAKESTQKPKKRQTKQTVAATRLIVVHLHRDFQDELLELLNVWNEVQKVLKFVPLRPPRELETQLLVDRPLLDERACELADTLRRESGFEIQDGIIQFFEGRLHGRDTHQLFASTSLRGGHLGESTISLRMMRILVDSGDVRGAPIFALIARQLLSVLGHDSGLDSHKITRGCSMDYCNEMPDIQVGLRGGPKFCPHCERLLENYKRPYLTELAASAKQLLSKGKDEQIDKRMKLRSKREPIESDGSFDVALSFAGEDRQKASALANGLKKRGLQVFYDDFQKSELWGADLYSYLSDLYRFRATFCVMFLSKDYARKLWTNHERAAAQERAFKDNRTYILPIRVDDTEIPGILSTVGYLRWDDEDAESIVDMIVSKLKSAKVI